MITKQRTVRWERAFTVCAALSLVAAVPVWAQTIAQTGFEASETYTALYDIRNQAHSD